MTDKPLINRVANSGLITINLENYYPDKPFVELDIKSLLFKELLLKEKDFRIALKEIDWSEYKDKILLIFCSNDAIIPVWAYMLIAAKANPEAAEIFQGTKTEYLKQHYTRVLESMEFDQYDGQRIVIKGCSNVEVPPAAYAKLTSRLQPFAQSIMYGEPCSTVPVFKRPRNLNKG